MIDLGLYTAYALIAIATLSALIFPIIYMVKHPKEGISAAIGIGVVLLIFLLGWVFASGEKFASISDADFSDSQIKLIGAGLNTVYILLGLGIVAIIVSEVKGAFK